MKKPRFKFREWAIFYKSPTGQTFACATHLGCAYMSSDRVNVYSSEATLNEIYEQTIKFSQRTKQAPEGSGHARWEGWLKPEHRNGRVFIARVGSKDFPVKLTETKQFNDEGVALRVAFEFN